MTLYRFHFRARTSASCDAVQAVAEVLDPVLAHGLEAGACDPDARRKDGRLLRGSRRPRRVRPFRLHPGFGVFTLARFLLVGTRDVLVCFDEVLPSDRALRCTDLGGLIAFPLRAITHLSRRALLAERDA